MNEYTFHATCWPTDAFDAHDKAHALCKAFYGNVKYELIEVQTHASSGFSGGVLFYRSDVYARSK